MGTAAAIHVEWHDTAYKKSTASWAEPKELPALYVRSTLIGGGKRAFVASVDGIRIAGQWATIEESKGAAINAAYEINKARGK